MIKLLRSKLLQNSAIYAFVSVFQRAIGFFIMPITTSVLSRAEYGTSYLVMGIVGVLQVLFSLSLHGAAMRFSFKALNDEVLRKKIWGTLLTFVLINTVLFSSIFLIFREYLLEPLARGVSFNPYLLLGIIAVGFGPTYMFFQLKLQAEEKAKAYGINSVCFFLLNLSLTLFFILQLKWGAVGLLASNAVTNIVFFIHSLISLRNQITFGIDKKILLDAIKYALPLVPYNLSSYIATVVDRVFINNINSTSDVGVYTVGYQFANIITVVTTALAQAYSPWFFKNIENGLEGRLRIKQNTGAVVAVMAWSGASLCLLTPFLMTFLVNKNYGDPWAIVPFLTMGQALAGTYALMANGLFVSKTYFLPIITFSGMVVNILLNFLLVPLFGIMGAAIASLLYNFTITIMVIVIVKLVEPIGFSIFRELAPFALALPFSLLVFVFNKLDLLPSLLASVLAVVTLGAIYFLIYRRRLLLFVPSAVMGKGE